MGSGIDLEKCIPKLHPKSFELSFKSSLHLSRERRNPCSAFCIGRVSVATKTLGVATRHVDRGVPDLRRTLKLGDQCRLLEIGEEGNQPREIAVIASIECVEVLVPARTIDDQWRPAPPKEDEQYESTRNTAVPVLKRMNTDKAVMEPGSTHERVRVADLLVQLDEAVDLRVDMLVRRVLQEAVVSSPDVVVVQLPEPVPQRELELLPQSIVCSIGRLASRDRDVELANETYGQIAASLSCFCEELESFELGLDGEIGMLIEPAFAPLGNLPDQTFGHERLGDSSTDVIEAFDDPGLDGVAAKTSLQSLGALVLRALRDELLPGLSVRLEPREHQLERSVRILQRSDPTPWNDNLFGHHLNRRGESRRQDATPLIRVVFMRNARIRRFLGNLRHGRYRRPAVEIVPLTDGEKTGAEARRDGKRVAHLVAQLGEAASRGRHAWVGLDDHSLAVGESPGLLADVYAAAGESWVADGYLTHIVVVPADDPLPALFGLGFGQEQVHARAAALPGAPADPEGFTIREADRAHRDRLRRDVQPMA